MVTASGVGGSSVPQNLGRGQKDCPDRNILGWGAAPTEPEKRPYVEWPTSSVGVYALTIQFQSGNFPSDLRAWPVC